MTEDRKQPLSEEEFEAYLEGRSRVSRSYGRLRELEPPAALDRSVLEQARAAVQGRPRRPTSWFHWSSRVAAAAVVVLAVGVALQFRPTPLSEDGPDAARRGAADDAPMQEIDLTTATSAAPASRTLNELKRSAPARVAVRPGDRRPEQAAADAGEGRRLAESATATGPEPPQSSARSLEAPISPQYSAGARADTMEAAKPPPEATAADDGAGTMTTPELEALAAQEAQAAEEALASEEAQASEEARKRALLMAYRESPDSEVIGSNGLLVALSTAPWRDEPETWLELIDALLEDGDEDAARRELEDFVDAWPDYALGPRYEPWLPDDGRP